MHTKYTLFYLVFLLSYSLHSPDATTIRVPEECLTIAQAIRDSFHGDVISIAPGQYQGEFIIENKILTFSGRTTYDRPVISGKFECKNSICSFYGIETKQATIIADQTPLTAKNCVLNGIWSFRDSITGYIDYGEPAIQIRNLIEGLVLFESSTITGGLFAGERLLKNAALGVQSCTNTLIHLTNTTIEGGLGGDIIPSSHGNPNIYGSALYVRASRNILFYFDESTSIGGIGKSLKDWDGVTTPYYTDSFPDVGGAAVIVNQSQVEFQHGRLFGGDSGNGAIVGKYDYELSKFVPVMSNGANGGIGLQALEGSHVILRNCELRGGAGGVPNGQPGEPYIADETSSVNIINDSSLQDWALH